MLKGPVERFVKCISDRKVGSAALIIALVAVLGTALGGALKYSSDTSSAIYNPTSSLESYSAYQGLTAFPGYLHQDSEAVLIRSATPSGALNLSAAEEACDRLNTTLDAPQVLDTESYWKYNGTALSALGQKYMNDDFTQTIFVVKLRTDLGSTDDTINNLIDTSNDLSADFPSLSLVATGPLTTQLKAKAKAGKGFALANGAGIPFIAVVFWWGVKSLRLLIHPLLSTLSSLMISWGLSHMIKQISSGMTIPDYEPDIQLFLCLALSIDYSFFLLTRFQEERQKGHDMPTSVTTMLSLSGEVIIVSGSILSVTWLALAFFPVFGLDVCGYLSAITVVICILSNLLITPVMLLTFPLFEHTVRDSLCCSCCNHTGKGTCATNLESGQIEKENNQITGNDMLQSTLLEEKIRDGTNLSSVNCYHRLTSIMITWPWKLVVPLVAYAIFSVGCFQLKDITLILGAVFDFGSGPAADAFTDITSGFPGVLSTPFTVLSTSSACNLTTTGFFSHTCMMANDISQVDGVVLESITSIATAIAYTPQHTPVLDCLDVNRFPHNDLQRYYYDTNVSPDGCAAVLTFNPNFNPLTGPSEDLVSNVRQVLDNANRENTGIQSELYQEMVVQLDAKNFVFDRFPYVVSGTLSLVFVIIACRFQSAIVPLKLAATIVVPIAFVFGIAVCVYQKGALNWLGINAFSSSGADGISWLLPCSTIFLQIGLALDYDIFLFSRVYENRMSMEYTTKQAIIEAVGVTGPVISKAGVIMALAFVGMLANDNRFLNQYGFIAILGVLLDTFVVRIVLVPSILSMGGWLNWWPGLRNDD